MGGKMLLLSAFVNAVELCDSEIFRISWNTKGELLECDMLNFVTSECLDRRGLWLRKHGAIDIVESNLCGHFCGQSMEESRNLLVDIH